MFGTPGSLYGKVVVVTGASGGVGRATAREPAAHGALVALIARGDAGLKAVAEEVEGRAYQVDVSDYQQVKDAADRIEAELGPIEAWRRRFGDAPTRRRLPSPRPRVASLPPCSRAPWMGLLLPATSLSRRPLASGTTCCTWPTRTT
ncbi:SDR family NAD(P)-dependent oxidoreductase [Actinocorallia longicatena]|uniref:Short subunit dehydrogenase n=1 Tax=Actinocorallia longicatena TaxID=111803 RepID=A0ABP6PVU6_9ACTN